MRAFARLSSAVFALAVALGASPGAAANAPPPARVVSINLCTDQLAMLLAAPGQLVSVSHLARDPLSSAMADTARAWPVNRGGAEEVFLMRPDLVLAGTQAAQTTVAMLRRLGLRVETFAPENGWDDIRVGIARMGRLLGREAEAAVLLAGIEARLAALPRAGPRPGAVIYHPNGYATGSGTLADAVLRAAGFRNLAAEAGIAGGGVLALEALVMAAPDVVITGPRYPGTSRAESLLDHPALARVPQARLADARWVCGTPHLLDALEELTGYRVNMMTIQ